MIDFRSVLDLFSMNALFVRITNVSLYDARGQ